MKKKMEKAQFQSKLASLVIDYGRQSFAEGFCKGFDSSSVAEQLKEAKEKANADYQEIMKMIDFLACNGFDPVVCDREKPVY